MNKKIKPTSNTMWGYISPKKWEISLGLIVKLIGTVVELLLPWMLSVILDEFVPRGDLPNIWLWGGLMVLTSLVALVANVFANRYATRISRDITIRVRGDLFRKVTSLPQSAVDRFTVPSLISRLTSDTYNFHSMVDRMQRLGVRAPILLAGGLVVTMLMEPTLTLIFIGIIPILALVIWLVSSNGVRLFGVSQQKLDHTLKRSQESMNGIRVIRALSRGEYEKERFDIANRDYIASEKKATLVMNISSPVMNLLLNIGLALVILIGAYRVNEGLTSVGTMIAFLSYFTIILNSLMMVSRIFMMLSKGTASANRIQEVLDSEDDLPLLDIPVVEEEGYITFDKVTFSYNKGVNNLEDISFSLPRGHTLGIIGGTGSGKSTIVKLLMRYYDVDEGSIRIDGRDVRSIDPHTLYSTFGVAMQNDFLFSGSVGENVDFLRDIPSEDIARAVETSQSSSIIEGEGYDRPVAGRGQNLSGGQKQRLYIARALANSPDILILDDSSSALDYATDLKLRTHINKNYADCTKIIVSQRIASVQNSDLIIVLRDGMISGIGTHEQLLNSCEDYTQIAQVQLEGGEIYG